MSNTIPGPLNTEWQAAASHSVGVAENGSATGLARDTAEVNGYLASGHLNGVDSVGVEEQAQSDSDAGSEVDQSVEDRLAQHVELAISVFDSFDKNGVESEVSLLELGRAELFKTPDLPGRFWELLNAKRLVYGERQSGLAESVSPESFVYDEKQNGARVQTGFALTTKGILVTERTFDGTPEAALIGYSLSLVRDVKALATKLQAANVRNYELETIDKRVLFARQAEQGFAEFTDSARTGALDQRVILASSTFANRDEAMSQLGVLSGEHTKATGYVPFYSRLKQAVLDLRREESVDDSTDVYRSSLFTSPAPGQYAVGNLVATFTNTDEGRVELELRIDQGQVDARDFRGGARV